ncbi:hypothetical protein SLE2022_331640 [Rubroshorea leprosula]
MGLKNSTGVLLLISLSCLFSSSHVDAKLVPASAPISSLAPSPTPVRGSSSRFIQPLEPRDIYKIDAAPMLKSICADTDHPGECISTLIPYTLEGKSLDPISVLEAAVQATNDCANQGFAVAKKLHAVASDPLYKSCLETCIDSYKAIIESNHKILDAIAAVDVFSLNTELSTAVDNVDTCDEAFVEAQIDSPMAHVDDLLGKMVSNNLAIGIDLVKF